MSEANVETVRRMYEAFHGGDADRALSHFDPEVAVDASRRLDGGTGRGREYLSTTIGRWIGTFTEWREEIDEIRDAGNGLVFVALTQRGRGKGSGIETEGQYALVYRVEGEWISEMTVYPDRAEALEAAGLSE